MGKHTSNGAKAAPLTADEAQHVCAILDKGDKHKINKQAQATPKRTDQLPYMEALKLLRRDHPEMFASRSIAAKSERALRKVYRKRRREKRGKQ
jgi:hypothetical protein